MIVAYTRVSSLEQQKGRSVESQVQELVSFAGQNNLTIDKQFSDVGWSGSILERPQLDELRDHIKDGDVQKLIIYHPDRLSRVQLHQLMLLDEFERSGVEVIFTSQPQENQSPETKLIMRTVLSMTSELERLRIKDRVRRGKRNWAEKGFVQTSRSPYGFTYVLGDRRNGKKGYFIHNEHEIKIVKKILSWALEHKSDREIIKLLQEEGIKTRTGKDTWKTSTIHKVLDTNLSAYAGVWNYGKYKMATPKNPTKNVKYKRSQLSSRVLNDRSEWTKVPIPELAIITQEEADRIRAIKRENKAVKKGNLKNEYLLQGKIICDNCKGIDYADNFHGVPYYRCADRKRTFPLPPQCPGGSIKAQTLEKAVWAKLTKLLTDPKLIKKEAAKFIERNSEDTVLSPLASDIVRRKLSLQKEKERLETAFVQGLIDSGGLSKQKARIGEEESLITQEENKLSYQQDKAKSLNIKSLLEDIDALTEDIKEVINDTTFEEKRNILTWLNIKVNYFKHNYSIEGAIPLSTTRSTKLHVTHFKRVHYAEDTSIPFLLTGRLQKGGFPYAFL